jgi:cytochrome c
VEAKPTGGWEQWMELSAPLASSPDWTDVYVVFVNPGKSGLMNLDWVQFDKR